ncbi:hypothetical protein [Nocardia cyriacigeorgica]|uniref:hypothetical protein n=1 Tax=Nocardia cyriacigeorgica TaxID=135487 RepID=UPI0024565F79|nr:hypothetical protein [Nocardia cyriacigeorgica]
MGDTTTGSDAPETGNAPAEFKAPASQEELDKIIGSRVARVKSQYADYDDLKSKAAKLDEIEQANKSELQKIAERAEAAERELAAERNRALRAEIAAAKGVPASSLTGSTKEELEASADELIAWRDKHASPKRRPVSELKSGASSTDGAPSDPKERAAAALRRMRSGG